MTLTLRVSYAWILKKLALLGLDEVWWLIKLVALNRLCE